jgi:hypothetical protein
MQSSESEMRWSGSAHIPRRMYTNASVIIHVASKASSLVPQVLLKMVNELTSLTRRMVDVSVPPTRTTDAAEVDTADMIGSDTLALLADAFKSTGNLATELARPKAIEVKDNGEWLKKVLASRNIRPGEPMPWDVVVPINGKLTMNFEDSANDTDYVSSPIIA